MKKHIFTLLALSLALLMLVFCTGCGDSGSEPDPVVDEPSVIVDAGNPAVADGWELTLVNADNPVPEGWETPEYTTLSDNYLIDSRIYPELQDMFDAARAEGVYPYINSAYRSKERQQELWDEKYNELIDQGYTPYDAIIETNMWIITPGTSEHQLGLAFDLRADEAYSTNEEVYDWFLANSWRYGFINRYPADKVDITGIGNEPWHYRYVGKEAAAEIYSSGLCLEEYLAQLD